MLLQLVTGTREMGLTMPELPISREGIDTDPHFKIPAICQALEEMNKSVQD